MKRSLFLMIILCFALRGLYAQQAQPDTQDSIKFESITYNYGTIQQGSDGECEFKFTNKGKSPIILSNVSASCGCTTPDWPKAPVKPNETGIIKVKYNTAIIGHFSKTITVYSNAVNSPVVLIITGEVAAK